MKVVNKRDMASILGVSEATLTDWQRKGMPHVKSAGRGRSNHYQTAKVIAWMIAREVAQTPAGESARDRHARLQGDVLELELAAKRREFVPVTEIRPAWVSFVTSARQALMTVPVRLAPLLTTMDQVDAIRELLTEELRAALTKLAHDDDDEPGTAGDGAGGPPTLGATTADPSIRVG